MKKIKVVHYIGDMDNGGAQALIRDYACLIDKDKFEVGILTLYPVLDTANVKILKESGVNFFSVYKSRSILERMKHRVYKKFWIKRGIKRFIEQQGPDIIHCHLLVLLTIYWISNSLKDIKLFYTCHTLPERLFAGTHKAEYKAADYLIKNNGLQIIALHEKMKNELNKMFSIDSCR